MSTQLDYYDQHIIRLLQEDASISNLELSKKIGLSPSACLARTKNLRESGVIRKYAVIVDEKKLGMDTLAYVMVNLTPLNRETITAFLEKVRALPQVLECYTLTGEHDFLLKIAAPDTSAYREFIIQHLMEDTAISKVETNIVMAVDKCTYSIPTIDDLDPEKE